MRRYVSKLTKRKGKSAPRESAAKTRVRPPLHVRFSRGYVVALIVGIIISAVAWASDHDRLDQLAAGTERSRAANALVIDVQATGAALGAIEDQPRSLVLRSDLSRLARSVESSWAVIQADETKPEVAALLIEGSGGLDAQLRFFLDDVRVIADAGARGETALADSDSNVAGRLEQAAIDLSDRLHSLIQSYEEVSDDAIVGMRTMSDIMLAAGVLFLLVLVSVLLRPLGLQLKQESMELREANSAHKAEARRQELASHLSDGLEAAETEDETHLVVRRAFGRLLPDRKIEMLLSESDRGSLQSAVVHPENGGPGCGVESTWACPAVRRGRTVHYDDSRSINACPHLADREPCSATCVPISFMGQSMGVLHTTGEAGEESDRRTSEIVSLVASQVSIRLGTLRSFAQVEMQASTDSLTGLPNRRATEDRLRRLVSDDGLGSIAMADLDRFKLLNDRHGHEAGDRALRMFADAVRESLRADDWIGRWGGEEFLLILPGLSTSEAKEALDRVRTHLYDACVRAEAPAVTVSMGVVDTTAAAAQDELVRLADDALLVAKAQGRDRVIPGPVMGPIPEDVGREGDDPGDDAVDETVNGTEGQLSR